MLRYWFVKVISNPDVALEIIVFITILFGSVFPIIFKGAPAFTKRLHIRISKVPDTRKDMFSVS